MTSKPRAVAVVRVSAQGLSYYGIDSTYTSSPAIVRRILRLEGALDGGAG